MYKQTYKSSGKVFPIILLTVTAGLCLLSIPSIIGISDFVWIYEMAIFLLIGFSIYYILRKGCYIYSYLIADDEVIIKLIVGTKDTYLCSFKIKDIVGIERDVKLNELKTKYGSLTVYRCTGKHSLHGTTKIVFKEKQSTKTGLLIFMPDKEFLQKIRYEMLDTDKKV